MENQDRCLYAIGIERRLAQGELNPEPPLEDVCCLLCYDKPERQSAILCDHYYSRAHLINFQKIFGLRR